MNGVGWYFYCSARKIFLKKLLMVITARPPFCKRNINKKILFLLFQKQFRRLSQNVLNQTLRVLFGLSKTVRTFRVFFYLFRHFSVRTRWGWKEGVSHHAVYNNYNELFIVVIRATCLRLSMRFVWFWTRSNGVMVGRGVGVSSGRRWNLCTHNWVTAKYVNVCFSPRNAHRVIVVVVLGVCVCVFLCTYSRELNCAVVVHKPTWPPFQN